MASDRYTFTFLATDHHFCLATGQYVTEARVCEQLAQSLHKANAKLKITAEHVQLWEKQNNYHCNKDSPVELVQVKPTGEVCRQYKGVTNALESRIHEARVAEVVEPCCTSFYWHCTPT